MSERNRRAGHGQTIGEWPRIYIIMKETVGYNLTVLFAAMILFCVALVIITLFVSTKAINPTTTLVDGPRITETRVACAVFAILFMFMGVLLPSLHFFSNHYPRAQTPKLAVPMVAFAGSFILAALLGTTIILFVEAIEWFVANLGHVLGEGVVSPVVEIFEKALFQSKFFDTVFVLFVLITEAAALSGPGIEIFQLTKEKCLFWLDGRGKRPDGSRYGRRRRRFVFLIPMPEMRIEGYGSRKWLSASGQGYDLSQCAFGIRRRPLPFRKDGIYQLEIDPSGLTPDLSCLRQEEGSMVYTVRYKPHDAHPASSGVVLYCAGRTERRRGRKRIEVLQQNRVVA